jgi:hypothetical protein
MSLWGTRTPTLKPTLKPIDSARGANLARSFVLFAALEDPATSLDQLNVGFDDDNDD